MYSLLLYIETSSRQPMTRWCPFCDPVLSAA